VNIIYNPISDWSDTSAATAGGVRAAGRRATPRSTPVGRGRRLHFWGFLTVGLPAALRQTPVDQVEAALVEGANGCSSSATSTCPASVHLQLMSVMIVSSRSWPSTTIYLLTQGGPAHATEMLSTYAYTAAFSAFQSARQRPSGLWIERFACSVRSSSSG